MCYVILLSTTSSRDLSASNDEFVRFSNTLPNIPAVAQLNHPMRWYLGSKSHCSCTFRHAYDSELGFGEPVDWYPEEPDELEGTLRAIRVIRELVEQGFEVDCFDAWDGSRETQAKAGEMIVNLSDVADTEFRFIENHYMTFVYEN
ncbi:MAG: hypothetical protein R3335_02290 [Anaerolineales bacterium]|nr:hypothetical protein [Anaerolineales bacterium]